MARPSFKEVPEDWKAPLGPYHQAPPEYGGEWWLVNPFTSPEPWLLQDTAKKADELPKDFLEVFGPRPKFRDFRDKPNANFAFRAAMTRWRQDLRYFKRAGLPEWATEEQRAASDRVFEAWEMRAPLYYEGRYGWMARFVQSAIPDYEIPARPALTWPHGAITHFQLALIERQITPKRFHPLFPNHLRDKRRTVSGNKEL